VAREAKSIFKWRRAGGTEPVLIRKDKEKENDALENLKNGFGRGIWGKRLSRFRRQKREYDPKEKELSPTAVLREVIAKREL